VPPGPQEGRRPARRHHTDARAAGATDSARGLRAFSEEGPGRTSLRAQFRGRPNQKSLRDRLFGKEKTARALVDYDRVASDILAKWDISSSDWVPLIPFVMHIAGDLYHSELVVADTGAAATKEE